MLIAHPYISDMHIEEGRLPGGSLDRVLVVRSRKKRPELLDSTNDNNMHELLRQLQSLDTLARHGFADFKRVEIRDN